METPAQKRERIMEEKYGGKEALKAKRKEWQAKSRKNYKGTGGFASMDKQKSREIQSLGGRTRWKKYYDERSKES